MEVKAGMRFRSTVSTAEFVVVRAPDGAVAIELGGLALVEGDQESADVIPLEGELLIGKRYVDDVTGAEILCTKAGPGTLTIDGRPLGLKAAKSLPSSD